MAAEIDTVNEASDTTADDVEINRFEPQRNYVRTNYDEKFRAMQTQLDFIVSMLNKPTGQAAVKDGTRTEEKSQADVTSRPAYNNRGARRGFRRFRGGRNFYNFQPRYSSPFGTYTPAGTASTAVTSSSSTTVTPLAIQPAPANVDGDNTSAEAQAAVVQHSVRQLTYGPVPAAWYLCMMTTYCTTSTQRTKNDAR